MAWKYYGAKENVLKLTWGEAVDTVTLLFIYWEMRYDENNNKCKKSR